MIKQKNRTQKLIFTSCVILSSALLAIALYYILRPDSTSFIGGPSPTPEPSIRPIAKLDIEKIYLLINAHRENNQFEALRINRQLETSAQLKLSDMIAQGYYRHEDTQSQTTWQFFTLAGYQYTKAAENLAFNIGSEWEVFEAWVKSGTHNKQLLDPEFTDIGIATDCESFDDPTYRCIVVAHFGRH